MKGGKPMNYATVQVEVKCIGQLTCRSTHYVFEEYCDSYNTMLVFIMCFKNNCLTAVSL